jgi:demethylmenaquinone methyltransferase/2-methoxy-6-polyprenyl-1,4-benzoquinol methylase
MHPMMPIILQRAWASKKISDAGRKGKKTMGEAVRQMFAAIAPHYDLLNTVLSFGLHHYWRQQAVACSSIPPAARLLDVCSGTADLALAFARHLGHAGQVVATDFCPAMLGRGSRKALQRHLRLTWALADAQCLPFHDAVFDAVTVAFGLRNVDNLATALREMYRVLRPGGIALVLEFGQPPGAVFGPLYRFYARYILPRLGAWVSGHPEAYTYLPRTAAVFPAGGLFVQEMMAQDFTDVRAQALSGGIVYLYRATRPTY